MRGDGVGDLGVLLLLERVIAAHHPLQLGELADHAADQIGFGQHCHPLGVIGSGSDQRRDLPREHAHALDAVILRAELLVKDDLLQPRHPDFEAHVAVLIEEEFGIGEPRADHPLTAGDDGLAAVGRFQIRH